MFAMLNPLFAGSSAAGYQIIRALQGLINGVWKLPMTELTLDGKQSLSEIFVEEILKALSFRPSLE